MDTADQNIDITISRLDFVVPLQWLVFHGH